MRRVFMFQSDIVMGLLVKIVNGFKSLWKIVNGLKVLIIFAKYSILDIWLKSEYASENYNKANKKWI